MRNGKVGIRKNVKGQWKTINKIEQLPAIATSSEEDFDSYESDNDSMRPRTSGQRGQIQPQPLTK